MTSQQVRWLYLSFLFLFPSYSYGDFNAIIDAENASQWDHTSLRKAVRSKDSSRRARAAIALGRMQTRKVIPDLLKLTMDRSLKVRSNAAFALGQLSYDPEWTQGFHKKVLDRLKGMLNDPTLLVRKAAIEALGKFGPPRLIAWLRPSLLGNFPALQSEALLALYRFRVRQMHTKAKARAKSTSSAASKPTSKPTSRKTTQKQPKASSQEWSTLRPLFAKLAASKDTLVRRNLAYYFARSKDKSGEPLLRKLATDSNPWVRYFALFGLRRVGSKQAKDEALKATRDKNYILRIAGVQLLQSMKQEKLIPLSLLKDKSFHVRAAVLRALGNIKGLDPNIIGVYVSGDPSVTVQRVALQSYTKLKKDESRPLLQTILKKHPLALIRVAAVQASRNIGWKQMDLLLLATKDKDPRVRSTALRMLADKKDPRAWEAITQGLQSKELTERGYAVYALAKRKESDVLAQIWSTYQNSQHSRWIELREELVGLLTKDKSKQATSYLRKALKDPAPSVSRKAKDALQQRGIRTQQKLPKTKYSQTPYKHIRFESNPRLLLVTNKGTMEIECYAKAAPIHCANLVGLAMKGFYNKLTWHRVISNFVIQGGDPDGSGWGDGGFQLRAEINRKRYQRGTLGMPRAQGWNTGSVQLFFTHTPTPHLDGRYTVFGQIINGLEVMDKIEEGDRIIRFDLKRNFRKVPRPRTRPRRPTKR
ncbi:MAG: hypothetical protein EP343_15680 [Deltaproteobacteria bacterium]|nr:MAG: hypothetical protein EP343_15680 [Deltaproteobacteria bacterium]